MAEKILIVDDEETELRLLQKGLEKMGYEVVIACDGQEGLQMVNQQKPDLILTDMLMPNVNGFTFCKTLKSNTTTRNIPIIIISARVQLEDSFEMLGVEGFLHKPIDLGMLEEDVQRCIRGELHRVRPRKIVVYGSSQRIGQRMADTLKAWPQFSVFIAADSSEVMQHAFKVQPDIIFMDVMTGSIPADELVTSLRCVSRLKQTQIMLYHYLGPNDDFAEDVRFQLLPFEEMKKVCLEAGATEDLGQYTDATFAKWVKTYVEKL